MVEVENAVIMAAGMSSRLAPLSYEKPKALLKIRGEVLIERQIRQFLDVGIDKISVIVGYRKEQFAYLKEKYGVELVDNPYYLERNNHSSLYVVREKLGNTYVSCADLYFFQNPFQKTVEKPYYSTVYKQGMTGEWCVSSDGEGKIIAVDIGGSDSWVMLGEALFDKAFSRQMVPLLAHAIQDAGSVDTYWEHLYVSHIRDMALYEKRAEERNIMEFDSLEELRSQAPEYRDDSDSRIMKFIAKQLKCKERELDEFKPIKEEEQVEGVSFMCRGVRYVYEYEMQRLRKATEGRR